MKKKISIDAFSVALIAWTSLCVQMLNVFNYYFRNDHLANAVGVFTSLWRLIWPDLFVVVEFSLHFLSCFALFILVRATTRLPSTFTIVVCIANNNALNRECAICQCVRTTVLFLNENKITVQTTVSCRFRCCCFRIGCRD